MPRRLLRLGLNLLTLLSLLLALGAAAVWVRTQFVADELPWWRMELEGDHAIVRHAFPVANDGMIGCEFWCTRDGHIPDRYNPDTPYVGRPFGSVRWSTRQLPWQGIGGRDSRRPPCPA